MMHSIPGLVETGDFSVTEGFSAYRNFCQTGDIMQTVRYRIHPEKAGKQGPGQPFSAALLSDLHNAVFEKQGKRILETLEYTSPRFILSAGDMVTAKGGRGGYEEALKLIREMTRICPVYLAQGNHEQRMQCYPERYADMYARYHAQASEAGAVVLDNESVGFDEEGMRMNISALSLPYPCYRRRGRRELKEEDIRRILGRPESSAFQILLAHHPDFFAEYCRWGADLVLAGHVHGGIVRLPLLGGVFGSTYRLFPRYTRGLYCSGWQEMIVSAGLGSHTIPLRIGNPTQLVILDFD